MATAAAAAVVMPAAASAHGEPTQEQQELPGPALEALASLLPGKVTLTGPGQPGGPPPSWNQLVSGQPSPVLRVGQPQACVECTCVEDVVQAVRFASSHGVKVYARGSGHHYGGACLPDRGLVVDLSRLKAVHVDPASRTARVQPGVSTAQLRAATIQHGLHFPGGHISSVGISGFILGGGNGWGVRHCGAAADNVLDFEVVALGPRAWQGQGQGQAGDVLRVNEETEPELFWGLKGAGMFLGIVTEFVVKLHPVPALLPCATAIYPLDMADQVGALYKTLSETSPKELELSLALTYIPPSSPSPSPSPPPAPAPQDPPPPPAPAHPGMQPVVIIGCIGFLPAGTPSLEGCWQALRDFAPDRRLVLEQEAVPYLKALATLDASWEWPGLCLYGHGTFVKEERFDSGLVQVMQRHAALATSPRSLILVAPAAPRGLPPASYGFRGSLYVAAYAMWPRSAAGPAADGDTRHVDWVHAASADTRPWVQGCYLNEVMLDQPQQAQACFEPETVVRLHALKALWDPQGLLREL